MRPSVLGDIGDDELHVMTWNVRRPVGPLSWRPVDRWTRRRPLLAALLAAEQPTVLGCQEVVPAQASVIAASLGPRYRRIGHGRSPDPRSEGCPIFFDSDRLELLDWRQSALSDTPDELGSRTWGNIVPRVLVVGIFRDRTTSARFAAVNTHFDPFSGRSRVRSAEQVRETALTTGVPVIVTGDANAGIGSPVARALFGADELRDAWAAASVRTTPEWGTFADYRTPRRGEADRLDRRILRRARPRRGDRWARNPGPLAVGSPARSRGRRSGGRRGMIENFLRPPSTPGEYAADGIRLVGLVGIVIAALVFELTDAGILAAALPVLLLPRFIGVAAWFDIVSGVVVLVAAWSNVFDLYTVVPGWDLVIHFVCTGVVTVITYLALVRAGVVPAASDALFRPRIALVLCPALGLALSVLWEMVEWFGHAVITDTISVGYADTIGDLAAGGAGAVVAALVVVHVRLDRRAQSMPRPSAEKTRTVR